MGVYAITSEGEQTLAAATAETVLQLVSAASVKPKLVGWGVSFDGATATDAPVIVELIRQSTAGTSSACTVNPLDVDNPTALGTGRRAFTVEPTSGVVLEAHEVHPQGGNLIREYPPGREPVLDDATTARLGIRVTAGATVNALAFMHWEE